MKKLKKKDKIFAMFLVIVIIFLFVAPFFIIPKIYGTNNIWNKDLPTETIFLELWEIDTFEGGYADRGRFLEKTAYKFQELNSNVYVFVRNLTLTQAKLMLSEGKKPDLVSFGIGAGELLAGYCLPIELNTLVRDDLLNGGQLDGQQIAMPWCMGGYMLASLTDCDLSNLQTIKKDKKYDNLIGYGGENNISLKSLDNMYLDVIDYTQTQYEAYSHFLTGNNYEILLGTQRDFYRLQNKVKIGAIDKCNYKYLGGYTDLVQYIAITNDSVSVYNCAQNFIKYLTSVTIQSCLIDIGMFGVTSIKLYENEYSDFENVMLNKLDVLNVFTSDAKLNQLKERKDIDE